MATKVVERELSRSAVKPRVLLVGLGGLGNPVAELLAEARVCDFVFSDDDIVDISNLPRQWLFTEADAGRRKTAVMQEQFGGEAIGAWTADTSLGGYALVIEGTDDVEVKFALADACVKAGVPLVSGGVIGLNGFVHTWTSRDVPCLRCIFEGPTEETRRTCRDAGVLSSLTPVVGSIMAAAALRILSEGTPSQLWSIDLTRGQARLSDWPKREGCAGCAQ